MQLEHGHRSGRRVVAHELGANHARRFQPETVTVEGDRSVEVIDPEHHHVYAGSHPILFDTELD